MKKRKILILSFYFEPDLCAGSFRTTALVSSLLSKTSEDLEFEVITTLPNRYSSFSAEALEYESKGRLTIRRIKLPSHKSGMKDQAKAYLLFALTVLKLVKGREYDLVYGTSSRLMTAALASWIARRKKIDLYLDIRDIFVDTIGDVMSPFWGRIFRLIERWSFSYAKSINLVSEGFREYFEDILPGKRLTYFTNGIDEVFLNVDLTSVYSNKLPVVLYAGNIGEGQGLHKIIPTLAKELEGKATFKIIGDGGRKSQLIEELKNKAVLNVDLYEPMSRGELIEEYKKADVLFLHLNDYKAFYKVLPSKLFEYGALNKPILAGLAGFPAKFLREEINFSELFFPCDVSGALNAFERLSSQAIDRKDFKLKYSRRMIMDNMALDINSMIAGGNK